MEKLNETDINILLSKNIDHNKCKILNYKGKRIYFYNVFHKTGGQVKDCWASFTGLTTTRPTIICDIICKHNCFFENMKVLDIGCGLSELGIELSTRFNNIDYDGIDIIDDLIKLNKLNLPNYNFIKKNIIQPELIQINSKDVVCALGLASSPGFCNIIKNVISNISPQFIILETHIGYLNYLENIVSICKDYKIKHKEKYIFSKKIIHSMNQDAKEYLISLSDTHKTWNRFIVILEKEI